MTGQKIGNDFLLDDGENVVFAPITEMKWSDWMNCPNCKENWFSIIRTGPKPYDFYHQCQKCNHIHYPPNKE